MWELQTFAFREGFTYYSTNLNNTCYSWGITAQKCRFHIVISKKEFYIFYRNKFFCIIDSVFNTYSFCGILRYILDVLEVRIIDRNFFHDIRILKLPANHRQIKESDVGNHSFHIFCDSDKSGGLLAYNVKCWRKLGFSSVGSIGSTSSIPYFSSGFRGF